MTRIELVTSSLPRKRSTPELHRRKVFTFSFFYNEISVFTEIFERETGFEPATFSLEG